MRTRSSFNHTTVRVAQIKGITLVWPSYLIIATVDRILAH